MYVILDVMNKKEAQKTQHWKWICSTYNLFLQMQTTITNKTTVKKATPPEIAAICRSAKEDCRCNTT